MGKTTKLFLVLFVCTVHVTRSQVTGYTFASTYAPYTSIIVGTSPTLTGDGKNSLADEGYTNGIPIGFSFNYLGLDYSTIAASTNGFASFGTITTPGFSNSLSTGGTGRPLLAPLWEDLAFHDSSSLQYLTSGVAGSRIFILQWSNAFYDFGAATASIAFQLRLYETTNVIEFAYNNLEGAVQNFSGGASIGITSLATGSGGFLSLNNSSSDPSVSSAIATNTIMNLPATGQVYIFTPPACSAPGNLNSTVLTATSATISWSGSNSGAFEYAVTTNPTPPASGIQASFTSTTVDGLLPCTHYYLHVRKDCSGSFSGWASIRFGSLCEAASTAYIMPLSSANPPGLPLYTSIADENNDGNSWKTYTSGGTGWTDQVLAYVYNINTTTAANDWLFTRGINLFAGTSYRLKFKYNNDGKSVYTEKLKIGYGTSPSAAAMTNMLANYPVVYNATPKSVSIDFVPIDTGIYYIGFHAYSDANKNVLILDEISLNITPSCDTARVLKAIVGAGGTSVNVSWVPPVIGTPQGYEYAIVETLLPPLSGTAISTSNASVNNLLPGQQYYLHVRTNCGNEFSDWATLPFTTVPNDEACNAITLTAGNNTVCGNTRLATSVTDPYTDCSDPDHTVWYKFTATTSGTVVLQITTPAAPADPLRGWINWYRRTGICSNASWELIGSCREFGNDGNNDMDYIVSPSLNAGITYYIMIDGLSGDVGEFCISIPACAPVLDPAINNILSTSANATWTGQGTFLLEYGPPGFIPGTDSLAGPNGIVIRPAISPQQITGLTLSTTYDVYIRRDCSVAGNGFGANSFRKSFTSLGPAPAHDNCSGAIELTVYNMTCGVPTQGSTLNATPSGVTPLPTCMGSSVGYDDDVWYKFTPGSGQNLVNIVFDSIGIMRSSKPAETRDMIAQIYTSSDGICTGTFVAYACSDDEGPGLMPGFYNLSVSPGTTYYIRLFTYSTGVFSDYSICVYKTVLNNDEAGGAYPIFIDQTCGGAFYTNLGATISDYEPADSCSSTSIYSTVWFKFTAPSGGAVRISTATGTANTMTNSRIALYYTSNVFDYTTFKIIASDDDGGSGQYGSMSVLYATGLISGAVYHIQVDKSGSADQAGTFCITVERISPSMLSPGNCNSTYQIPVGDIPGYKGWVSLMDENSKLVALVKNNAGAVASSYRIVQNIHTGAVRQDIVSGEYYLSRNYRLARTVGGNDSIAVQLFFLNTELNALHASDSAAAVARLRVTSQTGADCQPDFIAGNGINSELPQIASISGTINGVSWTGVNTTESSNYYIHSTRTLLTAKTFLQGAYNSGLIRHKDVTSAWADVLNTYALNQPYSGPPFNYAGKEKVPAGFFISSNDTTDIVDWILLEIKTNSGFILSTRAAFIREDGRIVDLDRVSPVSLYGLGNGNNNITIRHRNHLGIRTGSLQQFVPVSLGISPEPLLYNFTSGQNQAYQNPTITTNPAMAQNESVFVMWGGNANLDEFTRVISQGIPPIPSDAAYILGIILGGNPSATLSGYSVGDLNMDGKVRCVSLGIPPIPSDVAFSLGIVLGGASNATRKEHK